MSSPHEQYRWHAIIDKTKPHWLEAQSLDGCRRAIIKWDGCIHYYRIFNMPLEQDGTQLRTLQEAEADDDVGYIHLCDIDEEIARLQALRELALQFYVPDFGDAASGDMNAIKQG